MRFLVVSDEYEALKLGKLSDRKSWNTTFVETQEDAVYFAQQVSFQAAIVFPSNAESLSTLRAIHKESSSLPVIAVVPWDKPWLREAAWKAGALICVPSNAQEGELETAVMAAVRRMTSSQDQLLSIGCLELDLDGGLAKAFGKVLPLTPTEYLVLERLALARGRSVSRSSLMDHLYDFEECPTNKVIDVMVCKLRKKIENLGIPRDGISTIFGRGYCLNETAFQEPTLN